MQMQRFPTPAARFVRLLGALAIVLGIFGMHALSHHSASHEPAPVAVPSATYEVSYTDPTSAPSGADMGPVTRAHVQHQTSSVDQAAHMQSGPSTHAPGGHGPGTGDSGEPGHSVGDMVMLCVAMLVAAAASLLTILGLLRRVPRVWAVLFPAIITRVTRQIAPRGTGPPAVWQFSVIRC